MFILYRDLDKHIKAQVQYLVDNRQHCMGMGNLIKYLRSAISSTPHSLAESDAKKRLLLVCIHIASNYSYYFKHLKYYSLPIIIYHTLDFKTIFRR